MALSDDLTQCAIACQLGASKCLDMMHALGPRPDDPAQGLLWEQQLLRLQGQLNSLSALNSKLTAGSVLAGLQEFQEEIAVVGAITRKAQDRIKKIQKVSDALTKLAKLLDLGLAILAAAAAPSPATIAAVAKAGQGVADAI